jgi:hypothetical protein
VEDACEILGGKKSWYRDAIKASKAWGTPVATQLAFIHQESRFVANARPPRRKILWIFPGPRPSNAYGFAQAKTDTWRWYQKKSGNRAAKRDNFGDVVQFIGWYNKESQNRLGIKLGDAYNQYLAFHEGHGGFQSRSFNKKPWLQAVAQKVSRRAKMYEQQIKGCKSSLEKKRFWLF